MALGAGLFTFSASRELPANLWQFPQGVIMLAE
jgi:hypothetical protein